MLRRFHKKVYFPKDAIEKLGAFSGKLNKRTWRYTKHSLESIKNRAVDMTAILQWIKARVKLKVEDVFEYADDGKDFIFKACYRVNYNSDLDIILVVGSDKQIITIYYNFTKDKHTTLNEKIYCKG